MAPHALEAHLLLGYPDENVRTTGYSWTASGGEFYTDVSGIASPLRESALYEKISSLSIREASYKWTASASGTDVWYLEDAAGGDPGIDAFPLPWLSEMVEDPDGLAVDMFYDMDPNVMRPGGFSVGDDDDLGFNTVYCRLSQTIAIGAVSGGPFTDGEYIWQEQGGDPDAAIAKVRGTQGSGPLRIRVTKGTFQSGVLITGQSSGATATTSGTVQNGGDPDSQSA